MNDLSVSTEVPTESELMQAASRFKATAIDYVVDSKEMYDLAGDELLKIKNLKKSRNNQRLKITRKFDEAKEEVMALFRPGIAFLDEAIEILDANMLEYVKEQTRIREEAERVAREAQERARMEAEEKARKEAETARKAEEEAQEAARMAKSKKDKKAAEEAAEIARKAQEKADEAKQESQTIADAPPPAVVTEELKGTRSTWYYEIVDFSSLPDEYKVENTKMLNGMATSTKGKVDVPGVRFFTKTGLVSR